MSRTPNAKEKRQYIKTAANSEQKASRGNKVFWVIMLFFLISTAAYYLDLWIQG